MKNNVDVMRRRMVGMIKWESWARSKSEREGFRSVFGQNVNGRDDAGLSS